MRPRLAICRHTTRDDASAVALALAHTDYAGIEVSLAPHDPEHSVSAASALVALSDGNLDLRYHFPLGELELSDPSPSGAQAALDAMLSAVAAISTAHGDTLTVHAALPDTAPSGPRFSATLSRLRELVDEARAADVTVCVENLRWGATSDPDVLMSLADGAGARVTFDVGHANSSDAASAGYSAERFARELGNRIAGAHVYDREVGFHHAPEDLDRIGDTLHVLCDVECEWWTVELLDRDEASRTAAMLKVFLDERFGPTG
jgi:sugar phosphate isomerase/epimerase